MFATVTKITNTAGKSTVALASGGQTFNYVGSTTDTSKLQVGSVVKIVLQLEPAVNGVVPATGPTAGGTAVTITGQGFTGATAVMFGAQAATSVVVVSDTEITCVAPAQAESSVRVIVTTPNGSSPSSPASRHFSYQNAAVVSAITPTGGTTAGGTPVRITGTDFNRVSSVKFGSAEATAVNVVSATEITCVAPAGSGTVDVTVVTAGGTSATSSADHFTYA